MRIGKKHYRTIWVSDEDPSKVRIINQQRLPHFFEIMDLSTVDDFERAIKDMYIRGAGLIGATAGYGMYVAAYTAPDDPAGFEDFFRNAAKRLIATRPTAKNLEWAIERQLKAMGMSPVRSEAAQGGAGVGQSGMDSAEEVEPASGKAVGKLNPVERRQTAFETASRIADEDAEYCRKIGEHGLEIIKEIAERKKGEPVNILTHCNAGWLAFVDFGSATSPIYAAYDAGISVHVWVDETRPRNQGASLTAWELSHHGVPCHLIADNAGGHLMQHGMVDLVITGTDRTTVTGDVANKIGTYLKALASRDNNVPFYVALPSSSFDWELTDGIEQIPIEERNAEELRTITGLGSDGSLTKVLLCPEEVDAKNYGFDVTPARLLTGLITERGICKAERESILELYPEHK